MDIENIDIDKELPEQLKAKLSETEQAINTIIDIADAVQETPVPSTYQIRYQHHLHNREILDPYERAQSICFISKYEHLPILGSVDVVEKEEKVWLRNLQDIRHLLNEYRSIVYNQKDSVYYKQIHKFCHEKLTNRSPLQGLRISIYDGSGNDITDIFLKILGEKNKSIQTAIERCDFDYIYNGILQHSDQRHTDRFRKEYQSGELNYVFIKHTKILQYIKECLFFHYRILNGLTSPDPGPLYP